MIHGAVQRGAAWSPFRDGMVTLAGVGRMTGAEEIGPAWKRERDRVPSVPVSDLFDRESVRNRTVFQRLDDFVRGVRHFSTPPRDRWRAASTEPTITGAQREEHDK
ncbi:hypothetical protein [Paraburkholderia acidipaludis]|uniref:hypothetical protein n=1 Tax=Paraburkholderia acidipaludis TaxID=660537 RepID=UPI0005BBC5E8|nr:hypothetical protein [Paraburkholderia acidipaludis]